MPTASAERPGDARGGSPPALDILVVNWLDRENPQSGGAETHLHEVFGRLVRQGHRVTLLCSGFPGASPRAELDGIEVHRTGGRYSFTLKARGYFKRHLARRPFDVIVEDLNKVPVFTPSWTDRPVVLLVHHLFGTTAFNEAGVALATGTWLLERPVPRAFRRVPVIAVSDSTKRDLVARGMDPGHIRVVPNGIELDAYGPPEPSVRFPEPTALYLGRVKKYKRVDLPIRAIARLRDAGVAGRLVIAGRGDGLDDLRALAADLGLGEDRVSFLGFVDDAHKVELFRKAWVHVLTSPKEGWGIANLEAAACVTPTVASDSPGLRDSVLDGRTGYLVRHGDVAALADRMARLFSDPALRDRLGAQARAFAAGFSWDEAARGVLEVLRHRVVECSAAAPPAALPTAPEKHR